MSWGELQKQKWSFEENFVIFVNVQAYLLDNWKEITNSGEHLFHFRLKVGLGISKA